jgi:hypothetical protein
VRESLHKLQLSHRHDNFLTSAVSKVFDLSVHSLGHYTTSQQRLLRLSKSSFGHLLEGVRIFGFDNALSR